MKNSAINHHRACLVPLLVLLLQTLTWGPGCTRQTSIGDLEFDDLQESGSLIIKGRVSLGTPVVGAEVKAELLLESGSVLSLGTAITDLSGGFELSSPRLESGGLLLVKASGADASYQEQADSTRALFGSEGLLASAIVLQETGGEVSVYLNPWSTLQTCLAGLEPQALEHRFRDGLLLRALDSNEALAAHLGLPADTDLAEIDVQPMNQGQVPGQGPATLMGLATAGLSQMARMPQRTAPQNSLQLTMLLCEDLEDGVFDGLRPSGALLPDLTGDTTRFELARSIHDFLAGPRNQSAIQGKNLAGPGGLYQNLSMDAGPLYPPNLEARLFDPIPPELEIVDPSPQESSPLGARFELVLDARDDYEPLNLATSSPEELVGVELARREGLFILEVDPAELSVQGPVTFSFTATDGVGNTTRASRTLRLDTSKPQLMVLSPDQSLCHETWPSLLEIEAQDQTTSVVSVTVAGGEGCERGGAETWFCPTPAGDPAYLDATARDEAGNQGAVRVYKCRDNTGPEIGFGPPSDLGFWGPDHESIEILISDPSGLSLCLITGDNGEELFRSELADSGPLSQSIPILLPETAQQLDLGVKAWDSLENQSFRSLKLVHDSSPPAVTLDESSRIVANPLGFTARVRIEDAESGVRDFSLEAPLSGTFTPLTDGFYELSVLFSEPLPEDQDGCTFQIRARDRVGNQAMPSFQIDVDHKAPSIQLQESQFFLESDCTVALVDDELEYTCPVVGSIGQNCVGQVCGPIVKFASRLELNDPEDIQENNLPVFQLLIQDDSPFGLIPGPDLEASYTFKKGDQVLHQASLNSLGTWEGSVVRLPLASSTMMGLPLVEADFGEDHLPDRLEIVVKDAAGNLSSLEIDLFIGIRPPPILAEMKASPSPGPVPPSELAQLLQDDPEDLSLLWSQQGVTLAAFDLLNPTPSRAVASLKTTPSPLMYILTCAWFTGGSQLDGPSCVQEQCIRSTDPEQWDPDACEPPPSIWTSLPWSTSIDTWFEVEMTPGIWEPAADIELVELEPFSSVSLRLQLRGPDQVTFGPASPRLLWGSQGSFQSVVHPRLGFEEWALCTLPLQSFRYETTPLLAKLEILDHPEKSRWELEIRAQGGEQSEVLGEELAVDLVLDANWPDTPGMPR